ncbi:MAG: hypothetical protein M3O33_18580 [Cyanobacteriota bacterium]|nr:hypothetical protein [Cyanobacteriota bacterium]
MDDIARQARQGSVAAIIQTLNEQLADIGVRTRAVFADGVLQLLCEAATLEQLEQSQLVAQIRQILEGIGPRNIRRVKINSRLVREQQLLWLEEITRDPENQLLWSEVIILAKPNIFKRLATGLKNQQTAPKKQPAFPEVSSRSVRKKNPYRRGIISGISLSLLLLLLGWLLYEALEPKLNRRIGTQAQNFIAESPIKQSPPPKPQATTPSDPFVQAVRLAEEASASGRSVKTSAQWLDVAAKWERAADLMSTVQAKDSRYKTARSRIKVYRRNSEVAQKQARRKRS